MLFHLSYVAQVCFLVATLTYPRLRTPCVDVGYLFVVTHNTSNPNCAVTYIHPIPTTSSSVSNGSTTATSSAATSTTVPATINSSSLATSSSTTSSTSTTFQDNKTVQAAFSTERVFYNGDVFAWPAQGGEPYAQEDHSCHQGIRIQSIVAGFFTILDLVFTMASYVMGLYAKEVVHGKNCPKMRRYSKCLAWSTVLFTILIYLLGTPVVFWRNMPCKLKPIHTDMPPYNVHPGDMPQTFFALTAGAVFAVLTCIGSCAIGFASTFSGRPGTPRRPPSHRAYQKPLWAYCRMHSHSLVVPSRDHDPTVPWACKGCNRAEKNPILTTGPKYYCVACQRDHCAQCVPWLPWRLTPVSRSQRVARARVDAWASQTTEIQQLTIFSNNTLSTIVSNIMDNDTPLLLLPSDQQPVAMSSGQETTRRNTETGQSPAVPARGQRRTQQQAALPAHLDLPAVTLIEHYLTSVGVRELRRRGGWRSRGGVPRGFTGSGPHHLNVDEADLLNGNELPRVDSLSDPFINVSSLRGKVVLVYVSASRFENENRMFTDLLRDFSRVSRLPGVDPTAAKVEVLWLSDDLTDQQFEDSFDSMHPSWLSLVNSTTGQMTLPSQWTDSERELNAKLLNIFFPSGPVPGGMNGDVHRRHGGPSLSVFTADGRHMCVEAMSQLGFPKHTLPDRSFRPHFPRNRQTCDIVQEELEKTRRRLAVAPPAACGCLIVAFAASLFWLNDQPENQNPKKMTLVGLGSLFVLTPLVPTILWPELRSLDTLRCYSRNTLREKIRKYFLHSSITLAALLTVAGSIWGVVATNIDAQGWFWISFLIYSLDIALVIRIAMVLTRIPNKIRGFLGLSEDQRPDLSDAGLSTKPTCYQFLRDHCRTLFCLMAALLLLPLCVHSILDGQGWWSALPAFTFAACLLFWFWYQHSELPPICIGVRAQHLPIWFVMLTLSLVILGALAMGTELAMAFSIPVPESIPALPRNVTNRNEFGAYIQRPYDLSLASRWRYNSWYVGVAVVQALLCLGSFLTTGVLGCHFCAVLRCTWEDRLLADVSSNLTPQLAGQMILDNMTQRPAEKEQDSDDAEVAGDATGAPGTPQQPPQVVSSTNTNVLRAAAQPTISPRAESVTFPRSPTTNPLLTVPEFANSQQHQSHATSAITRPPESVQPTPLTGESAQPPLRRGNTQESSNIDIELTTMLGTIAMVPRPSVTPPSPAPPARSPEINPQLAVSEFVNNQQRQVQTTTGTQPDSAAPHSSIGPPRRIDRDTAEPSPDNTIGRTRGFSYVLRSQNPQPSSSDDDSEDSML